jgi:alpha(1,3/1,4) fucosyltransferase
MEKVYVTGRYKSQVISIKNKISIEPKLQWELVENPEESEIILFFDCVEKDLLNLPGRKILVRQEPKMVLPNNYNSKKLANFDLIIDVGVPKENSPENVNWPQSISLGISDQATKETTKAILINSNLLSFAIDEMYSLRRTIAYNSDQIDLYGYGWNCGTKSSIRALLIELRKFIWKPQNIKVKGLRYFFRNQTNYKGSVENKINTMEKYRIAVVIENSLSYVSEKIFDSFSAGCIPVYVGPDLRKCKIPNNLYIQAKPSEESIMRAIEVAQGMDYAKWFTELEKWLRSEECRTEWSDDSFIIRLKGVITS